VKTSRVSAQNAQHGPETTPLACPYCGDHPARSGASWTLAIPLEIAGLNTHVVNAGRARHVYGEKRRAWAWAIDLAARAFRFPPQVVPRPGCYQSGSGRLAEVSGKRRVEILRVYGGTGRSQSKLMDHDNLVGGAKPVLDMLVKSKLLAGDDPTRVIAHYRQIKIDEALAYAPEMSQHLATSRIECTLIRITELVLP